MNAFRDWLNAQLGADGGRAVQMILALLFVTLLLLLFAWVFRRISGRGVASHRGGRLAVVDAAPVDGHRRLVLLRRDDVEHLVMIGGPNDLLVESRILRAPPVVAGRPAAPGQIVAPAGAEPPRLAAAPEPGRAAPLGASLAAAVASAGAFVRARTDGLRRPAAETAEPVAATVVEPPAPHSLDPEPVRVDTDLFDTPLAGRAGPVEPRPAPGAPPRLTPEAAVPRPAATPPRPSTRPAAEPVPAEKTTPPPAEPPPIEDRAVIAEEIQRGLDHMSRSRVAEPAAAPAPAAPPRPRTLDDIDLLSEFDQVVSTFAREQVPAKAPDTGRAAPRKAEPPHPPAAPVEPAPAAAHVAVPVAHVAPPPVPVHLPPAAPAAPVEPPAPVVEPPHAAAPIHPAPIHPTPVPPVVVETAPLPAEPDRIEPHFDHGPGEPPVDAAPPVEPQPEPAPAAAPPRSEVDELEEEMARLLSELSGPMRR